MKFKVLAKAVLLCGFALYLGAPEPLSAGDAINLRIRKLGSRQMVLVPKGMSQVVLEERQGSGWKPVRVSHLRFGSRESVRALPVTLPANRQPDSFRMVAYPTGKFPARFLNGSRAFQRTSLGDSRLLGQPTAGPKFVGTGGVAVNSLTPQALATDSTNASANPGTAGNTPSAAVESDIWKLVGSQLYFFNQYRGMQVIDLTNPKTPVRRGTLRLAASGEQFYTLDEQGSHLALLGQSNRKATAGQSALFTLKVDQGTPSKLAEVVLPGNVVDSRFDSRLIDRKLYVVSVVAAETTASGTIPQSSYSTVLSTYDLSDPAEPTLQAKQTFVGADAKMQVVDGYLLLATASGWSNPSEIHVLNLGTPDGTPQMIKSLSLKGSVEDKFKMSVVNGAVVAVSYLPTWPRQTWIESFPLTGTEISALSQIELLEARGETLHASRFDGDRLYVVTFRNTDPLFVIDLANPANLKLKGVLEIPGWSTYIEPMGDRLLAVGVESNRVTVSLFDVAEMTSPSLLSRVFLGDKDHGSWSEANYDEKAVEFYPEQGVVMVPFSSWSPTGYVRAMQAVQVGENSLTELTKILHGKSEARRGGIINDHYVSISGQELMVMDRANTTGQADLEVSLAWKVDRVVPFGNYLLQFEDGPENGSYWGYYAPQTNTNTLLRITSSANPDDLLEELDLGVGNIIGVAQQENGPLLAAQWVPAEGENAAKIRTWSMDLSSLETLAAMTSVEQSLPAGASLNTSATQGLWLRPDTMVWYIPGQPIYNLWPWYYGGFIDAMPRLTLNASPVTTSTVKGTAAVLLPLKISGMTALAQNRIDVPAEGSLRSTSAAQADGEFLFFSHDEGTQDFFYPMYSPMLFVGDAAMPAKPSRVQSLPASTVNSWLNVVDFRAETPVVRKATSIPGSLLGVSQVDAQGAVVFTNSTNAHGHFSVQATAYDGLNAWSLDQYALPHGGSSQTAHRSWLFCGTGGDAPGVVALGYRQTTGRIVQTGRLSTETTPSNISVVGGHLLASDWGLLEVAEIGTAGNLLPKAKFDLPTNLWLRVERTAFGETGLWIPAGLYGVEFLPWEQVATDVP